MKTAFHCFKTVILGEVAAGKTSLRKTMQKMTSHLTDVIDRTVGVEQDVIQLDDNLQTCLHDFGGHNTYTYLHQVCLTNQTLIGLAVDLPKYESKNFSKMVGQWYQRTVSRVLQPYMLIIGTKSEKCAERDIDMKRSHIMNELRKLQEKQRSSHEKYIADLEDLVDQVLQLLGDCGDEEKHELIQNEDKFVARVKSYAKEHPEINSKIRRIFAKSSGIFVSNILSEISFRRRRLEKQPIVHKDMMIVSSKSMRGIEELRKTICEIVRENAELFPVFDIPVSWKNIIELIPQSTSLMKRREFQNFCQLNGITNEEDITKLFRYLCSAGIVFQYEDFRPCSDLQDVVFLKPNWIFEIVGCIYNDFYLSGERELPNVKECLEALGLTKIELNKMHRELISCGIMAEKVIHYILHKYGVSKENMQYVIGLLVHLDICCQHTTADGIESSECKYRFPFLLSVDPPRMSEDEWPTSCPHDMVEYHMHVYINSPVDPPGLFDKWSIRTNDLFKKRHDWKDGCIASPKEGSSKIRILNHGSESDDDVFYSVCLRVKPAKAATMRNVLTIIYMQLRFLYQQYPYVVMKWWAVCPVCEIPGQWPLDKILNVQPDQAATITCDECCSTMPVDRLFPGRTEVFTRRSLYIYIYIYIYLFI